MATTKWKDIKKTQQVKRGLTRAHVEEQARGVKAEILEMDLREQKKTLPPPARLKEGLKTQSLDEMMADLEKTDPGFTARVKAMGRPRQKTTKRGSREMRFSVSYDVAEKIVNAAAADRRSVSSWLALAAERSLTQHE